MTTYRIRWGISRYSGTNVSASLPPPQVVIFMALAKGKSAIRTGPLTLHTSTAIHIAQLITKVHCLMSLWSTTAASHLTTIQANFTVRNVEGEKDVYLIECEGIGHKNASLGKHLGL